MILFIVAAHTSSSNNCRLLLNTLKSVRRFHPGEPIIVVDNDSPWDMTNVSTTNIDLIRVVRLVPGRGQLGALEVGAQLLEDNEFMATASKTWSGVVLLQHSTSLIRKFQVVPRCGVVALMDMFDPARYKRLEGKLHVRDPSENVDYECNIARELFHRELDKPCKTQNSTQLSLSWNAASHGVVYVSRDALKHLKSMRLFVIPKQESPVHSVARMWDDVLSGETLMLLRNQGWERLAGMITYYFQKRSRPCVSTVVHKEHGRSFFDNAPSIDVCK